MPHATKPMPFATIGPILLTPPIIALLLALHRIDRAFAIAGVLLTIISLAYCFSRRRRLWAVTNVLLCLALPALYFYAGVAAYYDGSAALWSPHWRETDYHHVDPVYRCENRPAPSPRLGDPDVWLYHAGIKTAIALLGPMPSCYAGEFPTRDEAVEALRDAEPVDLADLLADRVVLSSGAVTLDEGIGAALLAWNDREVVVIDSAAVRARGAAPLVAVLYHGCLILRIPAEIIAPFQDPARQPAMIVLLDPHVGRPFAYYGVGGYAHARPPARWWK